MSRGSIVLGCLLAAGCPASEATSGATEEPSTSGADATSEGTTGSTTSSGASSETSFSTTTSGSESSDGVTSESSSSSTGCACSFIEIGAEEETPDGYSFAEQVEQLVDVDVPFTWTGVVGDPTTTLHLQLELLPKSARYGNGCGSCVGLSGRVRAVVDSDDGFLAERKQSGLTVLPGESARLDVVASSFDQFMGTLPEQPLDVPYELAGIEFEWDLSMPESPPHVIVYVPMEGKAAVLGESTER